MLINQISRCWGGQLVGWGGKLVGWKFSVRFCWDNRVFCKRNEFSMLKLPMYVILVPLWAH